VILLALGLIYPVPLGIYPSGFLHNDAVDYPVVMPLYFLINNRRIDRRPTDTI
jgi:hypothetical protein